MAQPRAKRNWVYVPGRKIELPAETPEQRSKAAVQLWKFQRDLAPLIELLGNGEADAAAQKLASSLLQEAIRRKLPGKKKDPMQPVMMIVSYLQWMRMGAGSEQAKDLVAQQYGRSVKAVEKVIYGNPAAVERFSRQLDEP